jgi:hypothetical protein
MGERYLQIFCNDRTLTSGLATKSGLSGVAALAARDEREAIRARTAAAKAGALIDVHITDPSKLPWAPESFDMVVIDNTSGSFTSLSDAERAALLDAARGVLRRGGRVELVERERDTPGVSEATLRSAEFKPVRMLAERDGFRFIEGLKG